MYIDGQNPCDICEAKEKASACSGCALNFSSTYGECANDECMLNYELGCLMVQNGYVNTIMDMEQDFKHTSGKENA